MEYSLTRDIGRMNKNCSVAIYNTIHANRVVDENGFAFQFTCNDDERVYYDAYFLKQVIKIQDYHPDSLRGVQVFYNIDLLDVAKLSRDYKSLTEQKVMSIVDQLMPLCVEVINSGTINKKGIIFNVNI